MKRTDFAIGILLVIVLAQLVFSIVFLRKLDQLQLRYKEVPVPQCVSSLAERVEQTRVLALKFARQAEWLGKRLDKCMEQLESQLQLEPMPIKHPAYFSPFKSDPNITMKYAPPPEPFYAPYEEPNTPPEKDLSQIQLRRMVCIANLQQLSLHMIRYCLDPEIENLDKRLRRLDEKLSIIADSNSTASQVGIDKD